MTAPAPPPAPKRPPWIATALVVGGLLLALVAMMLAQPGGDVAIDIPYTTAKSLIGEKAVARITLRGDQMTGTLNRAQPLGAAARESTRFRTHVPAFGDPELLPSIERAGVPLSIEGSEAAGPWQLIVGFLPWLVFIGLYWWFWRRMSAGNLPSGFGRLSDSVAGAASFEREATVPAVTFKDVAGQDNAKREVEEIVDFLRDPQKYAKIGAEVPRGVLLMGPPGTGKTLMARALAGEAGVPFFSISASEFIEIFVGVGASRVRRMFDEAKKRAPSIIFIDELDAVGRMRGTGFGGGHDEREQTLNQILAEMDGFEPHQAVIVLAATNRPDVLDPALLRPGRFDRHVTLELPDRAARVAILKVHTRKLPLEGDVDLDAIAAVTPGFSGADLKNLANEAAIAAIRQGAKTVSRRHFDDMRERILLGTVRTFAIQPEERHRLAVHEAGHVATAHALANADPIYKVTIIPRGRSLGATQQLPAEERHTMPRPYLEDRLVVLLGGRTAERELLESVSSGADDDIHQATDLARAMVARWGMSERVGPMDVRDSNEHPFLGREVALPRRFSDATAHEVDEEVRQLLKTAEGRAVEIVRRLRPQIVRVVAALEERETLEKSDIEALLGPAAAPAGNTH